MPTGCGCVNPRVLVQGTSYQNYLDNVGLLPGAGWTALGFVQVSNGLYSRWWTQFFPWPNQPQFFWQRGQFWSGFFPRNPGNLP
jgi:hypothetical protein